MNWIFNGETNVPATLVQAVLIHPRAIFLVQPLNVVDEPVVQEAEKIARLHCLAVLEPVGRLEGLHRNPVARGAVRGQSEKAGPLHQLLLAAEERARELDHLVQQLAYLFAAATAHHRQTKFLHRIHHDAVLIVHGIYADGAGVVPRQKGHMVLHKSFWLSAQAIPRQRALGGLID